MALVGITSWAQADYSTNFPGQDVKSGNDRLVTAIKLTTGTGTQTINGCQSTSNRKLFIDKTSEEFTCAPGETLKATVTSGASWTHLYIYIDEAGDGFGYEADETNHCALAGSDLKAWTHYKFGLDSGGWNSLGESTGGDVALSEIPSFTAPTEPGVYRMRYKTDWNCIDPKGNDDPNNTIINNRGAIIDVTLRVLSPLQGAYNNLLAQARTDLDFAKSTESQERWAAVVTDAANIYSPKTETPDREPGTGVHCLIDNNPATYWHSSWASNASGDNSEHYLQFDLGEAYSNLQMQYQRRQGVGSDHPTRFLITASNDGESYEEIKTIEVTGDADNVRHAWNIENETDYRYIRVRATETDNWRGYWHAAEMNFYHYEFVEGANLYTKAGEIATQLEAILANPATSPTQENVDVLQALCDALHNLIHAIDAYRNYPNTVNMYGGYKATDEQVAALLEAIENYDADAAAAIVAAMEAVDNARTAFTLVTERAPIFAAEKEDGSYLLVGGNNKLGLTLAEGSDLGKWAFVDFDGGKYLYNVGAKLFANNDLTMTATPTANDFNVVDNAGNASYPFMIKSGSNYINVSNPGGGYNEGLIINSWSNKDGGNQFQITVAADFDPATAVEVLVAGAAQVDMDRLEALQADLTQFIAGKEEYITADVRQAIETIMGDAWVTAIEGAYLDALENSTAYVSPDFWATLETQIAWVKKQINGVQDGTIALYTENGVVGGDPQFVSMPYFNTEVAVDVYTNRVVIKAWDGVEGSDLTVAYTGIAVGDEAITRIIGIEQTVNGEVVSQVFEDEDLDVDDEQYLTVTLFPQDGKFASFTVFPNMEMNGILLGEGEEAGMGQLSLFGIWQYPAEEAKDALQTNYSVVWPGAAVEIPAAKLELSYEFNEGKTIATVAVDGLTGNGTAVFFLNDDFEEVAGMVENGTFEVAPISVPSTVKVTVREYNDDFSVIYAEGEITIEFPEVVEEEAMFTTSDAHTTFNKEMDEAGFTNYGDKSSQIVMYSTHFVILDFMGVADCNLVGNFTYNDEDDQYVVYSVAVETAEAGVRALDVDDNMGVGSTITVGEKNLAFVSGEVVPNSEGGHITLAFADGYYYTMWGSELATAINAINAANGEAVYNLNGQRVAKAQNGLYIVNGKKMVVK